MAIINIDSSDISSLCSRYSIIENNINSIDFTFDNQDSYGFTEISNEMNKLKNIIDTFKNNSKSDINNIKNTLVNVINVFENIDKNINSNMNFDEIRKRIDFQYSDYLSFEEYQELVKELFKVYEDKEKNLVNEFNEKMKSLLLDYKYDIAPKILNSMIEDIYMIQTDRKLISLDENEEELYNSILKKCTFGTDEYNVGLLDFKNYIGNNVFPYFSSFNAEHQVPDDIWNSRNEYEKSLIILTNNFSYNISIILLNNAVENYESDCFYSIDSTTINNIYNTFGNISNVNSFLSSSSYPSDYSVNDILSHFYRESESIFSAQINYNNLDDIINSMVIPYYNLSKEYHVLREEKNNILFSLSNRFNNISEDDLEYAKQCFNHHPDFINNSDNLDFAAKILKVALYDYQEDNYHTSLLESLFDYINKEELGIEKVPMDYLLPPNCSVSINVSFDNNINLPGDLREILDMYDQEESSYSANLLINYIKDEFISDREIIGCFTPFMLNINGINTEVFLPELKKSIDNGYGEFDYLHFFVSNQRIDDRDYDKLIKFNENGIEIETTVGNIKSYFNDLIILSDGDLEFSLWQLENAPLNYIKQLYDDKKISNEEILKVRNIKVNGRNFSCSLNDLFSFYDETNKFSLSSFLNTFDLAETDKVFFNHLLGKDLTMDDLNIKVTNKGMDFFSKYGSVDQHGTKNLIIDDSKEEERNRLIKFGMEKYGLSEDDVYIIMNSLDDIGACSYADMCNIIYELYDFDNEKFQNDFSYPMIYNDELNGNQLLLDLYIYQNIGSENSHNLIIRKQDGSLVLNENYLIEEETIDVTNQEYMSHSNKFELEKMNEFLKNNNYSLDSEYQCDVIYSSDDNFYEKINEVMGDNIISICVFYKKTDFYQINNNHYLTVKNSAHAITGVGLTDEGVIAMSWGDSYYIPFDGIDNCSFFVITKIN